MDGTRFDTLTRALTTSRRGIFGTLLAGALLAGRAQVSLARKCKNFGKKCDRDSDCCPGMRCRNDECKCENGLSRCTTRCYDLDIDVAHCGACSTVCGAGESCCGGTCSDLNTDRENCGACGAACAADEICLAGACAACPTDNHMCGNVCCSSLESCCDDACVDDLASNENHCGECGNQCPRMCLGDPGDSPICDGPRCCGGGVCLKSLQFGEDNCGACGHACTSGESCCSGECVDLESNSDHCGACGDTCRNGRVCCAGRCVDLNSDLVHCGECGNGCMPIPDDGCCAGVCCTDRAIGRRMRCCNDQCVDVLSDPFNCGECGLVCASLVCCVAPEGEPRCCPPLHRCGSDGVCYFD
jgi:hypothetical protein